MTSINFAAVKKMEEELQSLLSRDPYYLKAANIFLDLRAKARKAAEKKRKFRNLIPAAEAVDQIFDKQELVRLLREAPNDLLALLDQKKSKRRPRAAKKMPSSNKAKKRASKS